VTITGHTTKGYSLYFDLTGKNTKNRPSHEKKKSGKYLNVECPLYIDE
jgi:hypothetical protein